MHFSTPVPKAPVEEKMEKKKGMFKDVGDVDLSSWVPVPEVKPPIPTFHTPRVGVSSQWGQSDKLKMMRFSSPVEKREDVELVEKKKGIFKNVGDVDFSSWVGSF